MDGISGPLNFARFLRPEEIGAMHTMLGEVVDGWDAEQPSCYGSEVWSPGWIPFMAFQGDAYCIDTAPGTAGTFGQVFMRPNVPDLEDPLSPTLEGFLVEAAAAAETAEVKNGTFTIPALF